jgi:hypothetical protein
MKNIMRIFKYLITILCVIILSCNNDENNISSISKKNNIDTEVVNFAKSQVKGLSDNKRYPEFKWRITSVDTISSLNTVVFNMSEHYLVFWVLYNYVNKNYTLLTCDDDGHYVGHEHLKTNFLNRALIDTDMKGIEDFLEKNYPILDTSETFLTGMDTLFRIYFSGNVIGSTDERCSQWNRIKTHDDLDNIFDKLNYTCPSYNRLLSDSIIGVNVAFNTEFFKQYLTTQVSFPNSYIYNYRYENNECPLPLVFFKINYRGDGNYSTDIFKKPDNLLRNFPYNYRIHYYYYL